jgi:hypothetical protein
MASSSYPEGTSPKAVRNMKKIRVRVGGPAEIQTQHIPNTNLQRYR